MKLAGSSWGTNAGTLWSSTLALCYSAAEYYAPVWSHSAHTGLVDVQLNVTLPLISGTLRPAPLPWLLVLANIEPRPLRRNAASAKLVEKAVAHDSWPIHSDIIYPPPQRLSSRNQLWQDSYSTDITSKWKKDWNSASVVDSHLVAGPRIRQPGFDLPRRQWSLLNRFRTVQGHCGACWKRWRQVDSDLCACGEPQTMSYIVDSCPLTKLAGVLCKLHSADDNAVAWLTNYGSP